jgi:hypothetical protein
LFGQGICNFHIIDALHLQEQEMIISMHYICKNTTSSTQQIEVLENLNEMSVAEHWQQMKFPFEIWLPRRRKTKRREI